MKLQRKDLKPAVNLESDFKAWEDHILAHQSVDVLDELFKIIYAKITDERVNLKDDSSICEFRAEANETDDAVFTRIQKLLEEGIRRWGILQAEERIQLLPSVLKHIVLQMQKYYLLKTPKDILGTAFEYFVTKLAKGEKGQFFTPRTVVEFMGKIAGVSWDKKILDPACGSGGFLVWVLEKVWSEIERNFTDPYQAAKEQRDYASLRIFGLDFEPRMTKIAQLNMLIVGDSRANIFVEDSLKDYTWSPITKRYIQKETIDIILTNPPFAGDIRDMDVLKRYVLAYKNGKLLKRQGRHILFLEMCLNYLRPGGILCIVLPRGIFNNPSLKYVRDFIRKQAKILACISLDPYVFAPHAGNRTGILLLKKKEVFEKEEPYNIFMAISYKSGKKQGGRPLYKTTIKGELIYDEQNKPIPDSDLDMIAEAYLTKHISPKLSKQCFWVKSSEIEDRIDPEYYAPSNLEFLNIAHTMGVQTKPLRNYAECVKSMINPKKTPLTTIRYIQLDDIDEKFGIIKQVTEMKGKDAPSRARLLVKEGDIITAISGSKTGSPVSHRIAIISREFDGCVVSTGFGVLRPKKGVDPYFLYAVLRSPYVLAQMRRKLQGAAIPTISENDLLGILIPDIPYEEQEKISEKVQAVLKNLKDAETRLAELQSFWEKMFGFKGDKK